LVVYMDDIVISGDDAQGIGEVIYAAYVLDEGPKAIAQGGEIEEIDFSLTEICAGHTMRSWYV